MVSKENAKKNLSILIDKFNLHPRRDKLSEEETREFITELFKILGWNFKSDEVSQEEKISKGFVDYGFRLNNIPVLFVEAKRTSADLQDEKFVIQATDYAWHKATTWAVLTNFKRLRIFNSYIKGNTLASQLRDIDMKDYVNEFESIWLLSKEGFEQNLINIEAEKQGKKAKEKPVEKKLFEDLNKWRELLAKDIKKNYTNKYSGEIIDEMVQLMLDRLILIRKIEDEGLESRNLEEIFNTWQSQTKKKLWYYLRELFFKYDDLYDSKIFEERELDKIEIEDSSLKEILPELYESKDRTIRYNFSFIDADVLGSIYEQYLGYLLKITKVRASGEESLAKRKEQGIYYTPRYVVDYIVKNTVGKKLNECKTWKEVEKIKIVDPACGSGSFLIRTFDEINNWYEKKGLSEQAYLSEDTTYKDFETVKDRILKNNLFGVDLDEKAVEIAQLNLLIKTADKRHKLPQLKNNIKIGNSLVDKGLFEKKLFVWENEFKSIFESGGFDVLIGNPPYVFTRDVEFKEDFKKYIDRNYFYGMDSISKSHARQSGKINLYGLFIIKAIKLLKENGLFGFIIPNNILRTTTYDTVRKYILDTCNIMQIVELGTGVFEGVTASTIILLLQKNSDSNSRNKNKIKIVFGINQGIEETINQKDFLNNTSYTFNITTDSSSQGIFEKMNKKAKILGDITTIHAGGIATGPNKKEMISEKPLTDTYKPMLEGKDIKPFYPNFSDKYIRYEKKLLYRARDENIFLTKEKLVTQRISGGTKPIVVSYDNTKKYTFNSTNTILQKDKSFSLKYIVALLNSDLLNYFYSNKFSNKSNLTVNISKTFLEQLPIKIVDEATQSKISNLADKLIALYKELYSFKGAITNRVEKIKEELISLNNELNKEVYTIYGISQDEQKAINKSINST